MNVEDATNVNATDARAVHCHCRHLYPNDGSESPVQPFHLSPFFVSHSEKRLGLRCLSATRHGMSGETWRISKSGMSTCRNGTVDGNREARC